MFFIFKHLSKLNNDGYAAVIAVLGISAVALVVVSSLTSLTINRQKAATNSLDSLQSYYTAEAGIEDVLLRMFDGSKNLPSSPHTLSLNGSSATITIAQDAGGNTVVQSAGNKNDRYRKIKMLASINTEEASFFYGAQAGDGGFEMDNNSGVNGNVYSNGSLVGSNGAFVTGDVVVSGNAQSGQMIDNVTIGGNALAPSFSKCSVAGDITYVSGGTVNNCTAGGSTVVQNEPIESADMPISQEQIDNWKQDAQSGGIISAGDYSPPSGSTQTIGPGVINGNIILGNNQTIILNGTVYVTGHVDVQNGSSIKITSGYGFSSGIMIADGWIEIKNNGTFAGSGQANSYVLLISTSACDGTEGGDCSSGHSAIDIHNNADGAIFYAMNGRLFLHNNVSLTQGTAWQIFLDNNAVVNYEIGLQSALFSGGPGASYSIDEWKEIF